MEPEQGPAPVPYNNRIPLQPGQLSKPEKVWVSATTIVIGFYQAAPYSDALKIFYKKSGAVFGTQVILTPASILGPELAIRQPVDGEVQYFEYEIKKLKPSTQYVIKIKTGDDSSDVRSDKMGTVSREEERSRDNDMRNFVGALVKLGDYDGLVVSYTQNLGIFAVRILQIDDVASSVQLVRFTSDYTENGVPVQAYTLSQVRFGRWGGAISGSKVVNEGELKWIVARAVLLNEKCDAAAAYETKHRMLQAQVEKVTMALEVEWSNRFRNVRMRAAAYLLMLALLAVVAGVAMTSLLRQSGRRQRLLEEELGLSKTRQAELEAEMQLLHLYRVSLELDVARRVAMADGQQAHPPSSSPAGATGCHERGGVCDPGGPADGPSGLHESPGMNDSSSGSTSTSARTGLFMTNASRNAYTAVAGWTASRSAEGAIKGSGGGGRGDPADGAGAPADQGKSSKAAVAGASSGSPAAAAAGGNKSGKRGTKRKDGSTAPGEASTTKAAGSAGKRRAPTDTTARGSRPPDGRKSRRGDGGDKDGRTVRGGRSSGSSSGAGMHEGRSRRGRGGQGGGDGDSRRGGGGNEDEYDSAGGGSGRGGGQPRALWGLPQRALQSALAHSRAGLGSAGGSLRREWVAEAEAYGELSDDDDQPDAWAFIHYVSHVYAMYLQEWMKVQLQKSVRYSVNEMLLTAPPGNRTSNPEDGESNDADGTGGGDDGDAGGHRRVVFRSREYEYDSEVYDDYYG